MAAFWIFRDSRRAVQGSVVVGTRIRVDRIRVVSELRQDGRGGVEGVESLNVRGSVAGIAADE